ncbi:MAG: hypothetical protein EOO24_01725 [Comamonadaceae bacterium]|nr:MAG: hypothetical protein EOO24_01725 [Comamonadaceae bacterium]
MDTASTLQDVEQRIAALQKERERLESRLQARRVEELKVLADAYARKLGAAGFTITEGIAALKPYRNVAIRTPRATEPSTR